MNGKNDLIPIENDKDVQFAEYEELLAKRDQLNKEAGSYLTSYIKEFGDMIMDNFELKIECIKKKKTISYCRRRINRDLPVDPKKMETEIDGEMKLYYEQLKDMARENELARKAGTVGAYRLERSKKMYRKIAKLIHPDINKKTAGNEKLKELWERVVKAYNRSDLDELDDLEVLVMRALEELGDGAVEIDLSDMEKRIERIERQINDIISTEPYIYKELFSDEGKKEEYRLKLQDEHDDYEKYLESLTKALEEMLADGGIKVLWKMN